MAKDLISITSISAQSDDDWTTAQRARAASLLNGVIGWIKTKAPYLVSDAVQDHEVDQANMIISEAILRAVGGGTGNVASESIGPSSVGFTDRASKPTLTRADEAALIALCPAKARRRRYGTIRTRPGY